MFNEKSDVWIQIYKAITVLVFILSAIGGLFYGLAYAAKGISGLYGIFLVLVWTIVGFLAGGAQLVVNMLIIQLLNNVQLIREKVELIKNDTAKSAASVQVIREKVERIETPDFKQ